MEKQFDEKAIFNVARKIDSAQARAEYLQQLCRDEDQFDRLIGLLRIHDEEQSFLAAPAEAVMTINDSGTAGDMVEGPGNMIGPYKLLQRIGEGGFGVVYMAEQTSPMRRKVALKIVKPGMDSNEVVARFEAERQALALMDHPNIARVLDAGTTDSGRPFFVMELVHGVPITGFCDDQKLTTRERLRLFITVCRAVQHAHQKGIIHRDLKPSNVMVTLHDDKPVPKVIDFGVSKALSQQLTERTMFTAFGQMVGTPLYMSPEQAQMSGLDVDTRSDVYSLGVLLYELLTGTTPFDSETLKKAGFDEMRRIIREDEPPRPSARISTLAGQILSTVSDRRRIDARKLGPSYRGELDWIVMKALEKDRSRRYESASDLASDVERFLNDEPVTACPPSTSYRFAKLVRRHKVVITTTSLVAIALILGLVGTTSQAVRANAERDAAGIERDNADAARDKANSLWLRAEAEKANAESERATAQRLLTSSRIDRAQSLCEEGEIGRGLLWYAHALRTAPTDADDLQRVIRANLAAWQLELHSLKTLVPHAKNVTSVTISPDGSRILSGGGGMLRLSHAETGDPVGVPVAREGVFALAYSPDGTRFVSGNVDGTAQVWDAAALEPIGPPLEHEGRVWPVAFSPDGARIITGTSGGTVRIWDATTGQLLQEPFQPEGITAQRDIDHVHAVAFTPAGARAVIALDSRTRQLWDIDRRQPVGPPVDHERGSFASAISPDGLWFATAGNAGVIRVWDALAGEEALPPMTHGAIVFSLTFSSDGSRLVSGGSERSARLWDATSGRSIGVPMRHRGAVYAVAFSHDGQQILTGSEDGTARLWDIAPQASFGRPLRHKDRLVAADFSTDGLRILTERDGLLQIRDGDTGRPIGEPFAGEPLNKSFFVPDRSLVWLRGQIRDVARGEFIRQPDWGNYVESLAFSPDGSRVLTGVGSLGGTAFGQLLDAQTGEPIGPRLRHQDTVSRVAFSPDGSRFVTGSFDATTQFWDAATLEPIGPPMVHQSEIKSLAWSPDGTRMATGFADWTVRLWNVETRRPIGLPAHHENIVTGAAFSPDGTRLLTASLDQTARLWDVATLKSIGPPLPHECSWPDVSFASNGRRMLAVGTPGAAHVWESSPGPLNGDVDRIVLWVQVLTGLELDAEGGIGVLDGPAWLERKVQLQDAGRPPAATPLPAPIDRAETDFARNMQIALDGRDLADRGLWDEAASTWADAIERSGNSRTLRAQIACWWDRLARDAWEDGRQDEAETALTHALDLLQQLHQEFPDTARRLDIQYGRVAQFFNDTNQPEAAAEIDQRRAALYPDDPGERLNLGRVATQRVVRLSLIGRFDTADEASSVASFLLHTVIDEIRDGNAQPRRLGQCHRLLGRLYAAAGRDQDALQAYKQALDIVPDDQWTHFSLADLFLSSTDPDVYDPDAALDHAKAALAKEPDVDQFLGVYGMACYRTKDFVGAVVALDRAAPNPAFDFYRAMAHAQLGEREQALEWYTQGVNALVGSFSWEQLAPSDSGRSATFTNALGTVIQLRIEAAKLLGIEDGGGGEETAPPESTNSQEQGP